MTRGIKRQASPEPSGTWRKRNRKESPPQADSDSSDEVTDGPNDDDSDEDSGEDEDYGHDNDSDDDSDHVAVDPEKLSPEDEKMAVFFCCTQTLDPILKIRPYYNRGMLKDGLQHCRWLRKGIEKRSGSLLHRYPFRLDPKLAKDIEANTLWIITQCMSSEYLEVVDYLKPCYQWDGDSRISTWLKMVRPSVNVLPAKMRSGPRRIV